MSSLKTITCSDLIRKRWPAICCNGWRGFGYSQRGKLEIIRGFSTETTRKSSMVRNLRHSSFRQYPLGGAVFRVACTSARLIHCIADSGRPVSRIEFTLKSSVYWPIIGLGTRTWSVAMRCRDPAGQSEFFVRDLHLKTFNWMYCYREFIVGIVVSAIAVFRLVDNVLSSSLHC